MSLTLALAQAALKRKFEKDLSRSTYVDFPVFAASPKMTDLDGDDFHISIQNENPQAAGSTYPDAAASFVPGTYNRFFVTQIKHYSLARIQGDVVERAAKKGDGAFVNLMNNESDGAVATEMKDEEIYMLGDGTGLRGRISSTSTVASSNLTLQTGDDIVKFDLNMFVEAYDGVTGTPTTLTLTTNKRVGSAQIVGITRDPDNPVITTTGNWNASINGLAALDFLVRKSDGPNGGQARVVTGLREWLRGGTTPGTLFQCNRNQDPVRLAGQTRNYQDESMEVAAIDMESRLGIQGAGGAGKTLILHTRDLATFKKTATAKIEYDRMETAVAGLSFKTVVLDGDYGPIRLLATPFATRGEAFMIDLRQLELASMGKWPRLFDADGQKWLRVANDDAYEIRIGGYGFEKYINPVTGFRATGFGN